MISAIDFTKTEVNLDPFYERPAVLTESSRVVIDDDFRLFNFQIAATCRRSHPFPVWIPGTVAWYEQA